MHELYYLHYSLEKLFTIIVIMNSIEKRLTYASINDRFIELAKAIIKQARRDKDYYFFTTEWYEILNSYIHDWEEIRNKDLVSGKILHDVAKRTGKIYV